MSSLSRLIGKKESAAEYYSSPDSSFVIEEGKAMHKDELAFLREIVQIIDTNMEDPKLSATMIAEKLDISTRVLVPSTVTSRSSMALPQLNTERISQS